MLPLTPFMWTSEWVTCFLASFGCREIGTMQVKHPEPNIATPGNVIPLALTFDTSIIYKRVVARKITLTRRFSLFCLLNK